MTTWPAMYRDDCYECTGLIVIGTPIVWADTDDRRDNGSRYVSHARCPEPYMPVVPCYRCHMVKAANGACGCG